MAGQHLAHVKSRTWVESSGSPRATESRTRATPPKGTSTPPSLKPSRDCSNWCLVQAWMLIMNATYRNTQLRNTRWVYRVLVYLCPSN